jgi:glutamyl-tRNA reductase
MTISVIGLNHKSASLDVREKYSFTGDACSLLLRRIKKIPEINEVILISTCNRTEIYTDSESGSQDIQDWLTAEKEYRTFTESYVCLSRRRCNKTFI